MIRVQPLPLTHPELTVTEAPGFHEYRVENWHLARNGSGNVIHNYNTGFVTFGLIVPGLLSFIWNQAHSSSSVSLVLAIILLWTIWRQCTQVISESVVVLPPHGIQLETRRGFSSVSLFTSRLFIPVTELYDVLINEGLSGWNVRYYLMAVQTSKRYPTALHIAYEHILPPFSVLEEVQYNVHQILLSSQL